MKKLLKYMRKYRKEAILGPLFKLLEACFELIVPLIVALIIDKGINENYGKKYIINMCLILIALGIIGLICSLTAQYFSAKAAVGFSAKLRSELFNKVQSLSYSEIDELGTSTMITRMTSDVNQVQSGVNLFLRLFLRSPFVVIGALIMAFIVDVKVALVFVIVIPVLAIIIFLVLKITSPKYKKVQKNIDKIVKSTRENLLGVRVIRAFNEQEDEIVEYNSELKDLKHRQLRVGYISAFMNPLTYVVVNLGIIGILYIGGMQVNSGELLQGDVIALYNYISQILVELLKLANFIIVLSKALACASRISNVMDMTSSLEHTSTTDDLTKTPYIEFQNVSLKYSTGSNNVLNKISFSVNKGDTIGVIGGTGSGKTSLINLLPHFYDSTEGNVIINGENVKSIDPEVLRNCIGLVPQKAVLFKGTIRSNMCWGKANATDEEIYEALKTSQAIEVVTKKEGALDAVVEQNGQNFSGGQRQRLTIARALINKPEIIILDDSASALDFLTDLHLRHALRSLSYKPTVFIVSQRTSSIASADKIIVLDDGKMVGFGSHDELLKTCMVYQEIYSSQFKGGE